jgi:hypothetical protein
MKQKRILTGTLLLLATCPALGQTNAAQYFYYTNKAELAIVDGQHAAAINYYDSSMQFLTIPLGQDVYNAALCHALAGNNARAFKALSFLVTLGVDMTIFNQPGLKSLKKDSKGWQDFMRQYPKLREQYRQHIDTGIIAQIKMMNKADQNFFCQMPQKLDDNRFMDSLKDNDGYLVAQLKQYFNKYGGYLPEAVVGLNYSKGSISTDPIFYILLRHHYQNQRYELTPLLKKAMENGYIRPELFASWADLEVAGTYGASGIVIQAENEFYAKQFKGFRSRVEEKRKSLWLCPIDDEVRKTLYAYCADRYGFLLFSFMEIDEGKLSNSYRNTLQKYFTKVPCATPRYKNK